MEENTHSDCDQDAGMGPKPRTMGEGQGRSGEAQARNQNPVKSQLGFSAAGKSGESGGTSWSCFPAHEGIQVSFIFNHLGSLFIF